MKRAIFLLIFISTHFLYSETSPFSIFGVGDIYPFGSIKNSIIEEDSISISSDIFSNWSRLRNMTFSLSYSLVAHNTYGELSEGSNYDEMLISGFNLALPFGERNIVGVSLYPLSSQDYTFFGDEIQTENSFGEILKKTNERYVGGVDAFSLLYVKSYANHSFSLDFFSRFGNFRRKVETLFTSYDPGVTYSGTRSIKENFQKTFYHSGFGFSTTAYYGMFDISGMIRVPFYSWGKEYNRKFNGVKSDSIISVEWPLEFGANISFKPNKNISSNFKFSGIAFESKDLGVTFEKQKNFYEFSLGVSYTPSRRLYDSYYKRISYGLYGAYTLTGIKAEENDINRYRFAINLGFPYNEKRSKIESQFFIENQGDKVKNGISDLKLGFSLTVTGSDNWWLKKKKYND
ncbi:MAG: hypothetical protein CR982_02620 [Candidatus Cloacimonadota bacterium]|nr:MAG: hypothetical protein CR982_02620 [Candidatus Cloacimonadota bacterium]PIE79323.1 MAG: hypothetical protein CSA15_03475 [Candidatus Delongbacteria bacterium]